MNPVSQSQFQRNKARPSMFRHLMRVFVKSFIESTTVLLTFVNKHGPWACIGSTFVKICEQTSFLGGFASWCSNIV